MNIAGSAASTQYELSETHTMKSSFIAIAIIAISASIAHATDRCTDAQWHEALSNAPTRDGILVAKPVLDLPSLKTYTVLVYDAQKEGYPLVCERRITPPGLSETSASAQRHPQR
jgi:hypothetical protein